MANLNHGLSLSIGNPVSWYMNFLSSSLLTNPDSFSSKVLKSSKNDSSFNSSYTFSDSIILTTNFLSCILFNLPIWLISYSPKT